MSKLEGTVEHYKKKLEDMGLLRRQVHDDDKHLNIFIMWSSPISFLVPIDISS